MAFITAETRSSIVELAMGMLNQAPSTAMLNTLIAKSVEGASIQDLADYIATTDAFTAEYPATQTAREFATEMFGKLITGGTLDADINTAVIDLLEGLLIAGTTKAQGFVAVIEFLANPANASHPDLGDISQSFQNRADAAEYFSITKELGGSTDAELAAAIASVTSDADTLTAANEAADATADAEEVVAGQTFTLTTGVDKPVGGGSDDTIKATGATLGALDVIDGGAGTDTLTITDTTGASEAGLKGTISNIENLVLTAEGGMGAVKVAAGTNTAAVAQKATVVLKKAYAAGDTLDVQIGGVVTTVTVGTIQATNGNGQVEAGNAIRAALVSSLADSATIATVDQGTTPDADDATATTTVKITSATAGSPLPSISVINNTLGSNSTGTVSMATAEVTRASEIGASIFAANVVKTGPIAIKEVEQITITDSASTAGTAVDVEAGTVITVNVGGVPYSVAATASNASAATSAEVATNVAAAINTALGGDATTVYASASSNVVTVTAPVAGVPLPTINVEVANATDFYATVTTVTANQAANTAGTDAVVYKATAFDTVTASVEGDINISLAADAVAELTTTDGAATVSGGADVNVTATKGVSVSGAAVTNAVVKAGTTSSVVTIGATGATDTTVTPILQTAKVTGGSDVLVSDEYLGVSTGTLTSVEIAGTKDTTVTLEGKSLTNLIVGTQATSTTITVTNAATEAHTLNITAGKAGVAVGTTTSAVTITDLTAEAMVVDFTAANASIALDGDSTLLTVTATGVGGGKLNLNGGNSGNGIVNFDASGNSGGLDISNIPAGVKTFSTGSGPDKFTTLQTAIANINAGDGADTVTIGAALAAGSTLDLGSGNDLLLKAGSGSPSIATDSTTVFTKVDGGDGLDTVSANLITAGNADQFYSFEVLGLTGSTSLDASLLTNSTIEALALVSGGGTFTGLNPTQSLTVTNIGSNSTETTLSYGVAGLGDSDTFTINFADPNADLTTATAWLAATAANVQAGTITAQGVENYVINSDGVRAWNSITLGANTDAETVTITGASNLDLAIASSDFGSVTTPKTGVTLIDGSAMTGDLKVDITGVVESVYGIAVKGGSGDDTITTGGEDVTLTLGSGADTVVASTNAINTLGATAATATEAVSEMITITDAAFGDMIDFSASSGLTVSGGVDEIDVSAATTLLGALNIAANAGATSGAEVDWFVYGGNTYALFDASGASSGGIVAGDVVIKFTGILELDNSTLDSGGLFTLVQ